MIEDYYTQNEGMMPMKYEIGESQKIDKNLMYLQDF